MPWTKIAELRGQQGIQGIQGIQGLPGVNAVANDTATAGYIAAASSATKTALKAREPFINIKDFGAVGNLTTDDTAAFNAAIAYVNAIGGTTDREGNTGITIFIPDGRYKITAALTPITASSVTITGASRTGTSLILSATGATFTFGDPTRTKLPFGLSIINLKFEYLADPPAGAMILNISYGFEIVLQDLQVVRIGTLVSCGTSGDNIAGGVTLRNIKGSVANTGQATVILRYGAGLVMADCTMFVRGVLPPVHPAPMTTVANTNIINAINCSWDTVLVSNCLFERFATFIAAYESTGILQNVFVSNCIFDYFSSDVFYLEVAGGAISTVRVIGTWLSSWSANCILITGSGLNDYHDFDVIASTSGLSALNYSNTSAKNNRFKMSIASNNRLGTAAAAVNIAANSTGFTLTSCRGNDDNGAGTWRNAYGVLVGANADNYIISDNNITGTTASYNLAANTAASKARQIRDNTNASYAGFSALAVPASAATVSNTSGTTWDIHIHGGTVSAISKNGTSLAGMTSGHIRLDPGESFAISYSAAPSITRFVQA
jgi:hypothetical protein